MAILADEGAEGFAFLTHQAHNHPGQPVFAGIHHSVVIPVREYGSLDRSGQDHSQIHSRHSGSQFDTERGGYAGPAGQVQHHIAFAGLCESISVQRGGGQGILTGNHAGDFVYALDIRFVAGDRIAVYIRQGHLEAADDLFLPRQGAGKVVVHVHRA